MNIRVPQHAPKLALAVVSAGVATSDLLSGDTIGASLWCVVGAGWLFRTLWEWKHQMPKGPRGEKRPADAIGLAVMVGKIATGEVEDTQD